MTSPLPSSLTNDITVLLHHLCSLDAYTHAYSTTTLLPSDYQPLPLISS